MSDLRDLISIMQQQLEQQRKEHKAEIELQRMQMQQQQNEHKAEIDAVLQQPDQQHKAKLGVLLSLAAKKSQEGMSTPSIAPFDSITELWQDYWSRFLTFIAAKLHP